jgi:RNA polymerase sigma-70 factor (ECF subfamily)
MAGHSDDVPLGSAAAPRAAPRALAAGPVATFDAVYAEHFAFAWRTVRRLGVDASAVDDVVQEIFLVVHRRLPEFEQRASMKTWLFGIVRRVVRAHRRTLQRKPAQLGGKAAAYEDPDAVRDSSRSPHVQAAEREAARVLHAILDGLDDDKREAFVLAELEQMKVPEIAEALETNVNTVYSRLRAARREFDEAVARHRARDEWRAP